MTTRSVRTSFVLHIRHSSFPRGKHILIGSLANKTLSPSCKMSTLCVMVFALTLRSIFLQMRSNEVGYVGLCRRAPQRTFSIRQLRQPLETIFMNSKMSM
ncbi:hypothetical protein EJ08DRAFT_233149 [Tothia fuscella]|uniref:Uncharacterized protein n=1 Tax=Tothia fuscella TaxID=1048955 RepID=A0A9P4U4U3_9PEZI|nr:hypothetical protein EJ08DRAFT_233149 [Tothia fuscella]